MKFVHLFLLLLSITYGHIVLAQTTDCYIHDEGAHARERVVDITKTSIDVSFEPTKGIVNGTVVHTFTPLRKVVDTLFLDAPGIEVLELTLDKNKVKYTVDGKGITLRFDKPLTWGIAHSLTIKYKAAPRKGLYFIGWNDPNNLSRKQIWTQGQGIDNRHWFPTFDDMGDKMLTDVKVTFDKDYQVLSNGNLVVEKVNKDNTKTWHYAMDKPHSAYLVMIAIGKYAVQTVKSKGGVVINNWYYPEDADRAEPTYRYTAEMMDFYEQEFGVKYPWPQYSQVMVQDFMYGAMENTSATIFGDFYNVDKRAFLDRYYIGTNAHELTHQWFGDYITTRSPENHWLHESFATQYQKHFERSIFGEDHYRWNCRTELWSTLNAAKSNNLPVGHSNPGSARHYPKGSLVIDMMRYIVGKEQFNVALQYYLQKHGYSNVSTFDLWAAFNDKLGINLDWFFDQWIHKGGEPKYDVSYLEVPFGPASVGATVFTVKQVHAMDDVVGLFRMPIVFEVHYTDGTYASVTEWIENHSHTVTITNEGSKKIAYVLFDPNSEIVKSVDFYKETPMLLAQALGAKNMIDRYDALVALRSVPLTQKRETLVKLFSQEPFYAVRAEVVKQLINDSELNAEVYLTLLTDKDAKVRLSAIENVTTVHPKYLAAYEQLLTDSSYKVLETALVKLTTNFPANTPRYLEATKNEVGMGQSVRIAWLEIAIATERDKYLPQLVALTSSSYEFRTRTSAMEVLKRLNYLDKTLVANLFDASLNPNTRLANPALGLLKHFKGQTAYQALIQDYYSSQTWNSWQQDALKGL
jgi:aminopeptidase N